MSAPPPADCLLLRVNDVAAALSLGRSSVYALLARGEIRAVHIGRSTRVTRTELERFVQQLENRADRDESSLP